MKLDLIIYNHYRVKIGMILGYFGLFVLFLNLVPFVWENYGLTIVYFAMFFLLLGAVIVSFYTEKLLTVGYILIEENEIKIFKNGSLERTFNYKDYKVKFSSTGFRGESNYKLFLEIGSLTTNPGINSITFYNDTNKFKYEILIKSQFVLSELENLLASKFDSI